MESTDDQLRARDIEGAIEEVLKDVVTVGKTVNGEYAIIREIGRGGMGAVYQAEDLTLANRKVAIKVINFPTNDPEKRRGIIERFRREAFAAGKVAHPNVIGIHAFKQVGGEHLQVMEYIDGRTLREEMQAQPQKALPPERAARIVIEFLRGVAALHGYGLCHRDLKPANVMLTHDGDRVKILDLGLVKFAESGDPATDMTLTQCGVPMGSPLYMAPEQINAMPDAQEIDTRTDIYAVGVILFQLLTGKTPFDGRKAPLFDQHRFDTVPKMVSPYGMLSPALQAIVEKAMAKKPADRYQTADKMREALERLLRPPAQKRGVLSTLALVLAIPVIVALGAAVLKFGPSAGPKAPVAESRKVEAAGTSHQESTPAPASASIDTAAIAIAPPPADEVVATAKSGCKAYDDGRTSDATSILTKVVAKSPGDAEALYCLCGSYARKSSLAASERGVCDSFLKRASKRDGRRLQVEMWLKKGAR